MTISLQKIEEKYLHGTFKSVVCKVLSTCDDNQFIQSDDYLAKKLVKLEMDGQLIIYN